MVNRLIVTALALIAMSALSSPARADGRDGDQGRVAPPRRIPDVIDPQTLPAGEPVAVAGIPKTLRRAVVTDAARRFEVDESEVVLARAERVTWSDGSLGCPVPGRMYTQALVPGYRITAATAAGARLRYHTDMLGNVVSCDSLPPRPALPAKGHARPVR